MRVHLVDDDDAARQSLAFLLELAGFEVLAWSSGADYLEERPDGDGACLITDLRMPGMDGVEFLRRLRECGTLPPTVVATGHGDVQMAVAALRQGALEFIDKPFDQATVLKAIARAVERRAAGTDGPGVDADRRRLAGLDPTEMEVLRGLAAGQSAQGLALAMGIGTAAVDAIRARMVGALDARSLAELLGRAIAAGLLDGAPGATPAMRDAAVAATPTGTAG